MDDRNISFEEVNSIDVEATMMAKLIVENYVTDLSKEEISNYFYSILKENEYSSYVFNEMLKKLEQNYNYSFEKINI